MDEERHEEFLLKLRAQELVLLLPYESDQFIVELLELDGHAHASSQFPGAHGFGQEIIATHGLCAIEGLDVAQPGSERESGLSCPARCSG